MVEGDCSVGVVFDITGRGDRSFNDAAGAGLDQAVADCSEAIRLGLQGPEAYVSRAVATDEQDEPELTGEDCT